MGSARLGRRRNEVAGLSPLQVYGFMACGRPVVASDLPGIREVIDAAGCRLVVSPEDPEALAEGIVRLLANETEAETMGKRGRAFAASQCTWARAAEKLEHVLARVMRE